MKTVPAHARRAAFLRVMKILGQPCAGPFLLAVSYIGIIVHHGSEGRA
ncbi:hypothetical protein [uncultured Ottowia sp.]|nr:hypothetical protein [uncultured Ottowia sp.]